MEKGSLQVQVILIGSKQMSFESSFERCRVRSLNVTDFTREGIPDSGGSIRKRTLSAYAFIIYSDFVLL